jgi:hypothetical protein
MRECTSMTTHVGAGVLTRPAERSSANALASNTSPPMGVPVRLPSFVISRLSFNDHKQLGSRALSLWRRKLMAAEFRVNPTL